MAGGNQQVLIDSDAHVRESEALWVERLPKAFEEQAHSVSPGDYSGPVGATDPNFRIPEMEQDGVTAAVLYTSRGMGMFHMEDAALQEACFRVYNDWILEYCSVAPDRLYGIGLISVYNIDNAVKELKRCRMAGMSGAMVWMTPHPSLPFSRAEHYDRLWAAAQDLEVPIHLHVNTGFDHISLHGGSGPAAGAPMGPERRGAMEEYCHAAVNERTENAANALLSIIFAGVLDRYPGLRLVLAECEIGYLPFYLQQWDYNSQRFAKRRTVEEPLELLPSEYFARQVYATFLEDPVGCQNFTWWEAGANNCMWSTDYPHSKTSWPHSRALMDQQLGHLPQETIQKLVHDNVIRLYGLKVPESVA